MFYVKFGGHLQRYTECTCKGYCEDCVEVQLVNNNYDKVDRNGRLMQVNQPRINTPVKIRGKRYAKK